MITAATIEARTWRRFTPAQRIARFAVYLAMVTAIVVSIQTVDLSTLGAAGLRREIPKVTSAINTIPIAP